MSLPISIHRDITGVVWYEQSLTLKVVQINGSRSSYDLQIQFPELR